MKNKKFAIIIPIVAVLALGAGYAYYRHRNTPQPTGTGINYGPPTAAEKKETEQNKEDVVAKTDQQGNTNNTQPSSSTSSASKKSVTPVITYWGQNSNGADLQVNGYVPGVIETDGVCTLSLTMAGKTVTTTRTALSDAQDTTCGLMTIAKSKLANGTWVATLTYSSPHSSGSSAKVNMKVM